MTDRIQDAAQPQQVQCPVCGGDGYAGIITHDMAIDAGMPGLEGTPGGVCSNCQGDGWVLEDTP